MAAEIFVLQIHVYIDSREKVTARYQVSVTDIIPFSSFSTYKRRKKEEKLMIYSWQLICPSKREVMVFGSFKQAGTLLPKAPKGWGWRTALLFDELADLLQGGALRVAAVVQLV